MSDGPVREMTLEEWVDSLPLTHGARGEYDRLRADRDQFERESCERFQQLDAALKRIEELKVKLKYCTNEYEELSKELATYHIITTDQIDAAWEYVQNILFATKGNADFKRFAKEIFEHIGIVACSKCGGIGSVALDDERLLHGPFNSKGQCPVCAERNRHGWVKE